jgi:hypothetical protein
MTMELSQASTGRWPDFEDPIVLLAVHPATHACRSGVPIEHLLVPPQFVGRFLVQRVSGVGLEEEELDPSEKHGRRKTYI